MSPRIWQLRIEDVLEQITDIEGFLKGVTKESFQTDKKTYNAVIRSLEVIGEAVHHLPDEIKDKYSEIPWRKMKDFRNVLIHEYFGVDSEIVWKTITEQLFPLKQKLEKVLKENPRK